MQIQLFTAPVFAYNVIGYEKTLIVYGSNILKIVAVLVFGDGYFVYWVARYGHIASIWCKQLIEKIASIHCKYSMCADKYFFSGIFLCRNVIENRLDLKSGQVILGAKDDHYVSHFHINI